jgi:hypothetical protein
MSAAMAALLRARGKPRLTVVEPGDGVIGEKRIGVADQRQAVAQVRG